MFRPLTPGRRLTAGPAENSRDPYRTVHTSGLLAVVGNTPIPFTVQGTCADPVFRPDVKAVAKDKLKSLEGGLEKAGGGLIKGLLGGKKN